MQGRLERLRAEGLLHPSACGATDEWEPRTSTLILELHADRKLQPPHNCIVRQAEDLPCGRTIHTPVRIAQIDVVEQVEELGAELSPQLLANREVLDDARVRLEPLRTDERIADVVAERSDLRASPGPARGAVSGQRLSGDGVPMARVLVTD